MTRFAGASTLDGSASAAAANARFYRSYRASTIDLFTVEARRKARMQLARAIATSVAVLRPASNKLSIPYYTQAINDTCMQVSHYQRQLLASEID